jgi:hypothetical protein
MVNGAVGDTSLVRKAMASAYVPGAVDIPVLRGLDVAPLTVRRMSCAGATGIVKSCIWLVGLFSPAPALEKQALVGKKPWQALCSEGLKYESYRANLVTCAPLQRKADDPSNRAVT